MYRYKAKTKETAHEGCDTCNLYATQAQLHLRRVHEASGQTTYTREHIVNGVRHFAVAVAVQLCPDCEVEVPADKNGEPIHPRNNCFYATV